MDLENHIVKRGYFVKGTSKQIEVLAFPSLLLVFLNFNFFFKSVQTITYNDL